MPTKKDPQQHAIEMKDPIALVTNCLRSKGHPRPTDWQQGLHPDAMLDNQAVTLKIFLVNRYWRAIIGDLPINTIQVRYALVETAIVEDWWMAFEDHVIPCIIENSLPPAQH